MSAVSFDERLFAVLGDGAASPGAAHLVGSECSQCGKVFFPAQTICTACLREGTLRDRALNTRGSLYAYTVVERESLVPKDFPVPYAYGYVDLPEGVRLVARLSDWKPGQLRLDLPVVLQPLRLRQREDGAEVFGFTFRPAEDA